MEKAKFAVLITLFTSLYTRTGIISTVTSVKPHWLVFPQAPHWGDTAEAWGELPCGALVVSARAVLWLKTGK